MNRLKNVLTNRMTLLGYDQDPEFYNSDKIVFQKHGGNCIHTFNYFNQQYFTENFLELNDFCNQFNEVFQNEDQCIITEDQKKWLESHDFAEIINHEFNNKQLEINFYPKLQGYYIKDKDNNHYILASIEKYNSQDFSGFRLFKYVQNAFSFPMQDYYIKNGL